MTEDDTFRKLKRCTYDELRGHIFRESSYLKGIEDLYKLAEKYGWTKEEVDAESSRRSQ
jgi:hypothetical protein